MKISALIFFLWLSSVACELPYLQTSPTVTPNPFMPRSITINWLSWESDGVGDGPITGYEVLYRYASEEPGDASYIYSQTVDSTVTTSVEINELDVDTEYDFVVVVVTDEGRGPPTDKTTYRTLCGAPSAPLTLSVTRVETDELEIAWELPPQSTWECSEVGPSLYLEWKPSAFDSFTYIFLFSSTGSYNLTTLSPCSTYDLKAQFTSSSNLLSPTSETITAATAKTEPPSVSYVSANHVENSLDIRVTWPYPVTFNGPCIKQFIVTLTPVRLVACYTDIVSPVTQTRVVPANSSGVDFSGLLAYTEYNATVTSSNELAIATTIFKIVVTRQTLPSILQALQVTDVSPRSVQLNWTRIPCEDLHGVFQHYLLLFTNNETGVTFTRLQSDINMTKLSETAVFPCMTYNVEVRVVSGGGNGPWSERVQFTTTPEVSNAFLNSAVAAIDDNPNALLVTWDVPNEVYCPIDYYEVSYALLYKFQCKDGDEIRVVAANATETSHTITGLLPYSTYKVFVRAHTEAGFEYDNQAGILNTAQKVPTDSPIEVTLASYTDDWLHFSFQRRDCNESSWSSRLVTYSYQLDNLDNTSQPVNGTSQGTYVRFEGLISYTRYSFRVLMRTEAGDGPYSDPVEGRTSEAEPGPPASITFLNKTESTVDIAWNQPTVPNGIILNYTIEFKAIEKPYDLRFPSTSPFSEAGLVGPAVFTYKLENLEPGTKYRIRVAALTAPGAGEYVSVEGFTALKTDIQAPEKPEFDPSRSSGTSVYIYIYTPEATYVTSYLVAVKKSDERRKRSAVIDGESHGTHDDDPGAYITAEIPKEDDNVVGFVVGDGMMYGGYLNAPLGKGTYSIRAGAVSRADGASVVSWSEPLLRNATGVTTGSPYPTTSNSTPKRPNPEGSSTVGIIVGVVIAVIVVLIVICLVVYYLRLRRKREGEDATDATAMEETEKENGSKP